MTCHKPMIFVSVMKECPMNNFDLEAEREGNSLKRMRDYQPGFQRLKPNTSRYSVIRNLDELWEELLNGVLKNQIAN
jgi:hypothetical protein